MDNFTFQQDKTELESLQLEQVETHDFIPPTLWPHNSPDVNPVD